MGASFLVKVLATFRSILSFFAAPSPHSMTIVDSLEWEMSIARYQSSLSSIFAISFALLYYLAYIPSEISSLQSYEELYLNLTLVYDINQQKIKTGAFAGGIGDEWTDPTNVNNAIRFYYTRIFSRLFLMGFMSFCIGTFILCRICVSDSMLKSYFQDYMFKELRGLHHHGNHFGTLLMRRLIRADVSKLPVVQTEGDASYLRTFFKKPAFVSLIVFFFNPLFFLCVFTPNLISRFIFPKTRIQPQTFNNLQHACFQAILYNDSIRRSANVPDFFKDWFCLLSSRLVPRRFFLKFCDHGARELLEEVDDIFSKFPIEQRFHLYSSVICNSNCCNYFFGILCLMLFLQNAAVSELIVASWFSIPFSQIQISKNSSSYPLFYNYRELTNWEYIINDHFLFLLFFAVNLTCSNFTMFLVLVPTLVFTAAGFASNDGVSVHFSRLDDWFMITLFFSYFLSFITNGLTYRNFSDTFANRANDFAVVSGTTMLELSHEFMSLSHITLEAMETYCSGSLPSSECLRVRCMMWLLRKQRLQIQSLRPSSFDPLNSRKKDNQPPVTYSVSIRKLFQEEFGVNNSSKTFMFGNFGTYFESVCNCFHSKLEFDFAFSDDVDVTVRTVESEIKHFLCSFMFSVLMNASNLEPVAKKVLRIRVNASVCTAADLDAIHTPTSQISTQEDSASATAQASHAQKSLKISHTLHQVRPIHPDKQYVQVVASITEPCVASSIRVPPWIASFYDYDNFAILEFITRMQGCIHIPRRSDPVLNGNLGTFAFVCTTAAVSAREEGVRLALRLLVIEDNLRFFENLKMKITDLPLASNYIIDHESNVADALHKFSNSEQRVVGRNPEGDAIRTYDIVLTDLFMPMEVGGAIDAEAGIKAAKMIRSMEKDKGFTPCLMIGITSGGERDQEDFLYECSGSDVWGCFGRSQSWDHKWDASVRAKLNTYCPLNA